MHFTLCIWCYAFHSINVTHFISLWVFYCTNFCLYNAFHFKHFTLCILPYAFTSLVFSLWISLYAFDSMNLILCISLFITMISLHAFHSIHFTLCISDFAFHSMKFTLCVSCYVFSLFISLYEFYFMHFIPSI